MKRYVAPSAFAFRPTRYRPCSSRTRKSRDAEAKLPEQSLSTAQALAAGPTKAYGLIKKALYASAGNSLDAQLDLERDLQREAGLTDDYREGVTAFKEKREPRFKGG